MDLQEAGPELEAEADKQELPLPSAGASGPQQVPEAVATTKRKLQASLGRCFGWTEHRSTKSDEVLQEEKKELAVREKRSRQEQEQAFKEEVKQNN